MGDTRKHGTPQQRKKPTMRIVLQFLLASGVAAAALKEQVPIQAPRKFYKKVSIATIPSKGIPNMGSPSVSNYNYNSNYAKVNKQQRQKQAFPVPAPHEVPRGIPQSVPIKPKNIQVKLTEIGLKVDITEMEKSIKNYAQKVSADALVEADYQLKLGKNLVKTSVRDLEGQVGKAMNSEIEKAENKVTDLVSELRLSQQPEIQNTIEQIENEGWRNFTASIFGSVNQGIDAETKKLQENVRKEFAKTLKDVVEQLGEIYNSEISEIVQGAMNGGFRPLTKSWWQDCRTLEGPKRNQCFSGLRQFKKLTKQGVAQVDQPVKILQQKLVAILDVLGN